MSQDRSKQAKTSGKAKQKSGRQRCAEATASKGSCCKVEALVSIDERGQMILPKDIRDRANIRAGDKLAVTSLQKEGKMCCILLTKADDLSGMMVTVLGPVVKDMT